MSTDPPNPVNTTDFDAYLASPDAQRAELWQLNNLLIMRRCVGFPLTVAQYEKWRGELVALVERESARASAEVRS